MQTLPHDKEVLRLRLERDLDNELSATVPHKGQRGYLMAAMMECPTARDHVLRGRRVEMADLKREIHATETGQLMSALMREQQATIAASEPTDKQRRVQEVEAEQDLRKKQRLGKLLLDDVRNGMFEA